MKISDDLLQYCLEDGFKGDAMRSSVYNMILSMAKEIKIESSYNIQSANKRV